MKITPLLPVIAAIAALAAPFSAQAKDKHDNHRERGSDHHDSDHHDRDRHDSDRHNRFNHGANFYFHTYPYSYGYGGPGYYGSSYYGSSYYYSRPRVGISYYSSPSYGYRGREDVYRGREAYSSYSDSLAADVQRELRRRGYYRGPLDGDIGPGSRAAIRAYQDDRGLSVTGRIDTSLLRSLGIG